MCRKTLFGVILIATAATSTVAKELDDTIRNEIGQLFEYLRQSDRSFYRNGKWHDSEAAVKHLRQKYRYLLKKATSAPPKLLHSALRREAASVKRIIKSAALTPLR